MEFEDWGLIDYQTAWDRQKEYVKQIQQRQRRSTLVFCEHPSVITVGRAGSMNNVISPEKELKDAGIEVIENNRGGDATLHNPGQLVGYPIFHLSHYKEDLHWFLRAIEDCIIATISHYGLSGGRVEGLTGVWIEEQRKICAIGINCSRWVTSHGFALNVSNNLDEFHHIIPCGITDRSVTSINNEISNSITLQEVKGLCLASFQKHFG